MDSTSLENLNVEASTEGGGTEPRTMKCCRCLMRPVREDSEDSASSESSLQVRTCSAGLENNTEPRDDADSSVNVARQSQHDADSSECDRQSRGFGRSPASHQPPTLAQQKSFRWIQSS